LLLGASVCSAHDSTASKAPVVEPNGNIKITEALLSSTSENCADYAAVYNAQATDVAAQKDYQSQFTIEVVGEACVFSSNAIPNHDFNDTGGFANNVSEQKLSLTITSTPKKSAKTTALTLGYDNAILLNGVKVDLLAAGCYGVGDGFIGCFDMSSPYRYDPMSGQTDFGTDTHNAHAQPNGEYHYHGNPHALFDDTHGDQASPVIGFAADGFPIFGSFFKSDGGIRKAESSYQLKTGKRESGPGGSYDGTFVDDYEFISGSGDLDSCNGMTIDGVYGYYVTDSYPHVLACFSGTPDASFQKGAAGNFGGGRTGNRGGTANNQGNERGGAANLTAAAEKLGVSVDELRAALGRPPNLEAASKKLGVTVRELRAALPARN
jgi:hypothetical protein